MGLTWSLDIEDGVSAPAARARDALVRYRAELARIQRSNGLVGAPSEVGAQQKIARAVFDVQLRQVAQLQKARASAAATDLRRQQELGAYAQRNAGLLSRAFSASGTSGSWGFRAWGKDTEFAQQRLEQYRRTQASTIADMRQMAGIGHTVAMTAVQITAAFAAVAVALTAMVMQLGRGILQMVAFREGALTTLRTMSGARTEGGRTRDSERQFAWAQQLARETPLDERGVIETMQQSATAGFRGNQQRQTVLAAADVGAGNPNDTTAASRYIRAIGQIRSRGRLQSEELNQLGEVGVGRQEIYDSLARQLNIRETGTARNRRIEQMMQRRQITGDQGVQAAQEAVNARFGGRGLGNFARSQGQTLLGTLSNLDSALSGFVTSIHGIEQTPGILAIKATLNAIASALSGATPAGQRLQHMLVMITNTVGGLFGRYLNPERIDRFFNTIAEYAPVVMDMVQAFGGGFLQGLVEGLGPLMNAFGDANPDDLRAWVDMARDFGKALGWIIGFATQITVALGIAAVGIVMLVSDIGRAFQFMFIDLPRQIVDGMINGLHEEWGRLIADVEGLSAMLPESVRRVLGIHSPSRVFAELGMYTAQGFAVGLDSGTSQITDAMGAMTAPTVDLAGLRGGNSIAIEVNVTGGGEGLAAQIRAELSDLFADLFERGALAGGP